MALDLRRALAQGRTRDVLAAGFESTRGAHPALDRASARLLVDLADGAEEAVGRRLVRDIALVMQASLLHATAPAVVADAFCRARLDAASDVFGVLPAGVDLDALVERARPR